MEEIAFSGLESWLLITYADGFESQAIFAPFRQVIFPIERGLILRRNWVTCKW